MMVFDSKRNFKYIIVYSIPCVLLPEREVGASKKEPFEEKMNNPIET